MRRPLLDAPTIGARGGVMGRPRLQPPDNAAKLIEDFAADGFSVVGISAKLGTTKEMLRRWMRDHPELQEAFDVGRDRERQALHNRLYRIAMEEDGKVAVLAATVLLNSRHGYRDPAQGADSRVHVTVNLPGAMSREEYLKAVTNDDRTIATNTLPATRGIDS